MSYMAVKDLKNTRSLRERLSKERELILTKDGQPFALIIGIPPENVEKSLAEIRRAMFSTAVMGARQKAALDPPGQNDIADEITKSRRERGIK
jgi:antitoxin (DNA-binding transcriptional repressor) of toxin-antitoxin stability system